MTADKPKRVPGLLRTSILFKDKVLLSPDLWIGALVGVAAWILVPETSLREALNGLTSAGLAVATALVGVVIAALAVVVAFLDDEFIALMDRATSKRYGGMEGQLFPFWFVAGLGVGTILLSVGAIAFAQPASVEVMRALVAVLSFLLVWTSLGVLNLVGYIHATGVSRALYIRKKNPPDK
jgi:hypothetical protein